MRDVDVDSAMYKVATEYMIRLEAEDLDDPSKLEGIAEAAGLTPETFRHRYGYLVGRGTAPR